MLNFSVIIFIRIILIIICCLLIGYNRGKQNQFAGIKTHLFVGLGAGLSFLTSYMFYNTHNFTMDPFRLSAQVISGIGFLGAGTIIKNGNSIKGLTTAASLWVTAIISISIASGMYIIPISITLLIVILLAFSSRLDITRKYSTKVLKMTVQDYEENIGQIDNFMKNNTVLKKSVAIIKYKEIDTKKISTIRYEVVFRQTEISMNEIINKLAHYKFIQSIDLVTELERT